MTHARRHGRAGRRPAPNATRRRSWRNVTTELAMLHRESAGVRAIRIQRLAVRHRTWQRAGYLSRLVYFLGVPRSYHFLGAAQAAFKYFAQAFVDGLARSKN